MKLYNSLAELAVLSWTGKNYLKEVNFIINVFKKYRIKPKLIYDVACGTGPHSRIFLEKGFDIVGFDLNQGMINLAKKQVPQLKIYKQDMRYLNVKKKADCIITMFNAINHLESYSDFEKMLKSYWSSLNEGGLVIFDTNMVQTNWKDNYFEAKTFQKNSLSLGRINRSFRISKNLGFAHQVFALFEGKNKKAKVVENSYKMFIFDVKKVKEIIKKVGFKIKIYYDFSLTAKHHKGSYYVFVLTKI